MQRAPRPAKILLVLIAVPLALMASSLCAQPSNSVVAAQQCVYRSGQTAPWSAPSPDNSGWKPYTGWKLDPREPYVLLQCTVDPAWLKGLQHPAIQVHLAAAYRVSWNGVPIGENGNLDSGMFTTNFIRSFPIKPSQLEGGPALLSFQIAYRFTIVPLLAPVTPPEVHLGDEEALRNARSDLLLSRIPHSLYSEIPFIVIAIACLVLLGFWLPDRARIAPVLLATDRVVVGILYVATLCGGMMLEIPVAVYIAVGNTCAAVSIILLTKFFFALDERRVPLVFKILTGLYASSRIFALLVLLLPLQMALGSEAVFAKFVEPTSFLVLGVLSFAPFVAFWPYRRVPRPKRLIAGVSMTWGVCLILYFFSLSVTESVLTWQATLDSVGTICVIATLIVLLSREQRAIAKQRAQLAGEMHAAQQIQRTLVAALVDSVDCFRIDVAFHPAGEVGGDFYCCRILSGNRQRILIGDVSGKGAAAAMTSAVLLGAAQKRENESPATLLQHLNLVMADMHIGGFATCLCADIASDGTIVIANAGHLAPYCREQEIALSSGLPLGIAKQTTYAENTLQLAPGDSLTFISDGVVEAQGPHGELFGFDRTCEISNRPAEEIAAAAKQFGQQDDITVLTLSFSPVPSVA